MRRALIWSAGWVLAGSFAAAAPACIYPTSASFDFVRGAIDDELAVSITDLQPLE